MATRQTFNEIVKPMERGQITIPAAIRKNLKITPQTWLWVRLIKENKIVIEPVEETHSFKNFSDYLAKAALDTRVYWAKQDLKALQKVEKKSSQRLKKYI